MLNKKKNIDSGAISLFEAGIWITISLVVLIIGISLGGGLFSKNDTNTELSNISELMNNTRTMLKTNGVYNFDKQESMIGSLIQFGGAPGNMSVIGDKTKGNARLHNVWGGDVSLAPKTDDNGDATKFVLSYAGVPQEACITLVEKLSTMSFIQEVDINGNINQGQISAGSVGAQCVTKNSEHQDNNISFISNN
ncbi:type 4 pilus major pilin [Rosenbergiella nectarea]|uniref:type 4 pilus major pilin n=1 Tax=Rosenbergiella nectarea TaxID=988801 RepID=UPI001F4D6384|nr:type 4 pilus major pilin [Rosenbergiella nectarea]